MKPNSLLAAAGLAASTADALLLPPDLTLSEDDIISTLPVPVKTEIDVPMIAQSQSLKLKCPGCPIPVGAVKDESGEIEATIMMDNIPSHLELDFTIDASEDADKLLLNGWEIYPQSDPFASPLTAVLRPDVASRRPSQAQATQDDVKTLGFGLTSHTEPTDDEDDFELTVIDLQIIEVGQVFVGGVPSVQVKLIKTPAGKLMIGNLDTTESETSEKTPMEQLEDCTGFLCKWRALMMQKLGQLRKSKGCHGPASMKDIPKPTGEGHRHAHGHAHAHAHAHGLLRLLRIVTFHVLLPIAIGVLAGITASVIGMMVGTLVVFVWRALFRSAGSRHHHGRARGHSHKAGQNELAAGDEKAGLMEDQEEADVPPAYVEAGVTNEADKKPENEA
ncbi:hypothetical protein F4780DRAFT_784967 [Xylariomycetidae sp. FL0641]|nr:hypothetical protein F4780DRAFT_784967 [Xylariomycetidae sp. FL0641]